MASHSQTGVTNSLVRPYSFLSPPTLGAYSNVFHHSVDTDKHEWIGPFNVVCMTRPLSHTFDDHNTESSYPKFYDDTTDICVTLNTLSQIGLPSGCYIEIGSADDVKGRASRIDCVSVGTIYPATLDNPINHPRIAKFDDNASSNLLADNTLYVSPHVLTQISYTPSSYSHIPIDHLLRNAPSNAECAHMVQFNKTQTDFAPHIKYANSPTSDGTDHNYCLSNDNLLSINLPFHRTVYLRVLGHHHTLPKTVSLKSSIPPPMPQLTSSLPTAKRVTFLALPPHNSVPEATLRRALYRYLTSPTPNSPNRDSKILQQAEQMVHLQAQMRDEHIFGKDGAAKTSKSLLSSSAMYNGRLLHVGMVIAVPITVDDEDAIFQRSLEAKPPRDKEKEEAEKKQKQLQKLQRQQQRQQSGLPPNADDDDDDSEEDEQEEEDDDEKNQALASSYTPIHQVYFFVGELEYNDSIYTVVNEMQEPIFDRENPQINGGDLLNFLTCKVTRTMHSTVNSGRQMCGQHELPRYHLKKDIDLIREDALQLLESEQGEQYKNSIDGVVTLKTSRGVHEYAEYIDHTSNAFTSSVVTCTETLAVSRTSSSMIANTCSEIEIIPFNLAFLRPSLQAFMNQPQFRSQYTQYYLGAISNCLFRDGTATTTTSTSSTSTQQGKVINQPLFQLIRQYPSIIFPIEPLDQLLLCGFAPHFNQLVESLLPSFFTIQQTHVLPLLQSPDQNGKSLMLRVLAMLLHLEYYEIDCNEEDGVVNQAEWDFISTCISSIIHIRRVGMQTMIPQLPHRRLNTVNSIYVLSTPLPDVPNHVMATEVINIPLPGPSSRSRLYLYSLLSHIQTNALTYDQLSAMSICLYVLMTGYTNASSHAIRLLAYTGVLRIANEYRQHTMYLQQQEGSTSASMGKPMDKALVNVKDVFIPKKESRHLVACHCHVLSALLSNNSVASGIPSVSWKDIGAAGPIRRELMALIKPKSETSTATFGLQRRGVLLYGPPGSGKTLVAKALAGESGIGFVTANAGEILSMYIGESEKKIRELFVSARNSAPCVLFLDEIDSLAPSKNNAGSSSGGGVMQRIVSQLLLEIDALNDDHVDVFLVGATNRPELLDLSLLRPGRLDRSIYVGISSTVDDQLQILRALTRKFTFGPLVNLRHIIEQYCKDKPLTGADFFALASTAMTLAIMDSVKRIEGNADPTDDEDYDVDDPRAQPPKPPKPPKASTVNVDNMLSSKSFDDILTQKPATRNPLLSTATSSLTTATSTPKGEPSMVNFDSMLSSKSFDDIFAQKKPSNRKPLISTTATSSLADSTPTSTSSEPTNTSSSTTDDTAPQKKKRGKRRDLMMDGILDFGIAAPTPKKSIPKDSKPEPAPPEPQPEQGSEQPSEPQEPQPEPQSEPHESQPEQVQEPQPEQEQSSHEQELSQQDSKQQEHELPQETQQQEQEQVQEQHEQEQEQEQEQPQEPEQEQEQEQGPNQQEQELHEESPEAGSELHDEDDEEDDGLSHLFDRLGEGEFDSFYLGEGEGEGEGEGDFMYFPGMYDDDEDEDEDYEDEEDDIADEPSEEESSTFDDSDDTDTEPVDGEPDEDDDEEEEDDELASLVKQHTTNADPSPSTSSPTSPTSPQQQQQQQPAAGIIVYQRHFIQAALKLTPSLSKEELEHYAKIRKTFSSKRSKK